MDLEVCKTKLSVVIPTFNSRKYVEECVESVLAQSYQEMEIILVDDGSTDGTPEILHKMASGNNRIKLATQKHRGVTSTRKAGVGMASGEYVTFVDSDDWVENKYYEKMMKNIGDEDVIMAGGHISETSAGQNVVQNPIPFGLYTGGEGGVERIWKNVFPDMGLTDNSITRFWDKVCRTSMMKEALEAVPDAVFIGEDRCAVTRVLLHSKKVKVIQEADFIHHRENNPDSLTHVIQEDYLMNMHYVYQFLKNTVAGHPYEIFLKEGIDRYLLLSVREHLLKYLGIERSHILYYPYYGRLKNAKIILYGAGRVGRLFHRHIIGDGEAELVAWVDRQYSKYQEEGLAVLSPEYVKKMDFDYVILAVYERRVAMEIKKELKSMGVFETKILWNKTYWEA